MKCKNPNCNKDAPEGSSYCSQSCVEQHKEIKKTDREEKSKEIVKQSTEGNPALDVQLRAKLTNPAWQRGLAWRQEKIEAVVEARHRGISEKEIFIQLKRSGLIDATAKAIMADAHYLE